MSNLTVESPNAGSFERLIACREACPVHTDARGYVQAVARGDYALAYRIARAPNPFASICGRVCGAPCESACRRGFIDQPVSIRAIKRTATERHGVEANEDPRHTLRYSTAPGSLTPSPRGQRVAIVGAGVAGLTAAHDLARLGYAVTVFESGPEPGGMLRTGVPIYRMPRDLWRREIDAILSLGIDLRCNVSVGADVTLSELQASGFEAVLVAVGLQRSRRLELPGVDSPGILLGLKFLESFNAREPQPAMGRVVVIGGGNVAYDCARSARRISGTTEVTLVCLEALDEMPADEIEILDGHEEGIRRLNRRGPVQFVGDGHRLEGLETRAVSRVFDEQGRFAPELVPGTEEIIPCDTVLVAVGQTSDPGFANGMPELEFGRGGIVVADRETGQTKTPWLFAVGDAALGPGLFIQAIAHAQRSARAIHRFLSGAEGRRSEMPALAPRAFVVERVREGFRRDYLRLPRCFPPAADVAERIRAVDAQVELAFDDEMARLQAARCLRCDVQTIFNGDACILCGGCADVCPTWCLKLVAAAEVGLAASRGSVILKDEERCIRCGACAERCPTDAITMARLCGYEPWAAVPSSDRSGAEEARSWT